MEGTEWSVPCLLIEDTPRFKWRGAMLDVSRHFIPKEFVRKYIDLLAIHNHEIQHEKPTRSLRALLVRWSRAWPNVWFVLVAVLSLRPSWKREFHTQGPLHVPGHALIFAVSAFVACRSAQSVSQRVIRCAAVISFGCALESLQSWIFRSRFEWVDVVTDACGVLLVLLFVTCADSMRKNRHSTPKPCNDLVTQAAGFSRPVSAEPLLRHKQPSGGT